VLGFFNSLEVIVNIRKCCFIADIATKRSHERAVKTNIWRYARATNCDAL